ncbi:helix-turn-helix transcriptional regulator [Nocardiopsis synnemataformans]|uniref:helix-turn-helix transcriptional regulator n=1 Tax=Nocardiopsis synnemataformans TaxID=61305 RepID=UPI003EC06888
MTLGDRIRTARQRARLTQEQLAARVGVGRRTIDNWENGRTSPKNLVSLEEALGSLVEEHTRESAPPETRVLDTPFGEVIEEIIEDLEADTEDWTDEERDDAERQLADRFRLQYAEFIRQQEALREQRRRKRRRRNE